MDFKQCCMESIANADLVNEFNRLTGLGLGKKRTPIEMQIDEACGHDPDQEAMPEFINFVFECIWLPLVAQEKQGNI